MINDSAIIRKVKAHTTGHIKRQRKKEFDISDNDGYNEVFWVAITPIQNFQT